jgi:glycosyltransferase involved in cell wall biosynthesis
MTAYKISCPRIVFLTNPWSNLTDLIREGKKPAGTASVYKIWQCCAKRGWDVHVVVFGDDPCPEKAWRTLELNCAHFYWVRPTAGAIHNWIRRKRLPIVGWGLTLMDWVKMGIIIWRVVPRAHIYYAMRNTFGLHAWAAARLTGAKAVIRHYGTFLYDAWTNHSLFGFLKWILEVPPMLIPADLVIMTNDGTCGDRLLKAIRVPKERCRFWLNGMQKDMRLSGFDKQAEKVRLGLPRDCIVLMTTGRLADWKRQDRVIRSLPRIVSEFPNTKYALIGEGPERYNLESLARELGVDKHIWFAGAVSNETLPLYLNIADIYCQVNDVSNLSTTLIEALAAGCPCITREVGVTTDIIDAGKNAVLLSPGEAEDIAETILHLLRNPDERRALGERAYEDAMRRFQTWDERMDMEVDELLKIVRCK